MKQYYTNQNELEEIKNYYKSVQGKIDIENYQNAYIEKVNNEISQIKNKSLVSKIIGKYGRIQKIQDLYSNYIYELKYGKYNQKQRYHYKKNY